MATDRGTVAVRMCSRLAPALVAIVILGAILAMAGPASAAQFHAYVRQSTLVPRNITDALAAAAIEATEPSAVTDSPSLFLFDADCIEEVEQLIANIYSANPEPQQRRSEVATILQTQVFVSAVQPAHTVVTAASWGLDRINQRSLPLDNIYTWPSGNDGTGVTAWVVDTGIDTAHQEFLTAQNTVRASNVFATYSPSYDCNGHGTHVSGTIGGATVGVARNIQLRGVKVLNCAGAGTTYTVAQGLLYVLSHLGSENVINLSLGYGARDSAIEAIINDLMAARAVIVAAAGNEARSACLHFPSAQTGVISVASSTSSDAMSSFTNWGTCVNLIAPGSYITSARMNGGYTVMSGTSMASPHVAGAVALILQTHPGASNAYTWSILQTQATQGSIAVGSSGTPNLLLYSLPVTTASAPPTPSRAAASPSRTRAPVAASPSRTPTKAPKPPKPSKSPTRAPKPPKPSKSGTRTPSRSKRPRRVRDFEESSGASLEPSYLVALCALGAALLLAGLN